VLGLQERSANLGRSAMVRRIEVESYPPFLLMDAVLFQK
jgi:hypothetical protein